MFARMAWVSSGDRNGSSPLVGSPQCFYVWVAKNVKSMPVAIGFEPSTGLKGPENTIDRLHSSKRCVPGRVVVPAKHRAGSDPTQLDLHDFYPLQNGL